MRINLSAPHVQESAIKSGIGVDRFIQGMKDMLDSLGVEWYTEDSKITQMSTPPWRKEN